jgi:riboflavin kinase/FMN adenylyltransferase
MRTVEIAGERASSTAVRTALTAGEMEHAAALLGRPYRISGRVTHGAKLGRSLGFPTANIPLRRPPSVSGVFAVRVHGLSGGPHVGAASVGVRPTVEHGGTTLLEVFIFDFAESIYGRRIHVDRYFRHMKSGVDYREIIPEEVDATAVYRIKVEAWSGKETWAREDFPGAFTFTAA